MMNRFFLTLGLLGVGIHFIGWGIQFSGADVNWNPVWSPISALFSFELSLIGGIFITLKWLAGIAVMVLVVSGGVIAVTEVLEFREKQVAKKSSAQSQKEFEPGPIQYSCPLHWKSLPLCKEYPKLFQILGHL